LIILESCVKRVTLKYRRMYENENFISPQKRWIEFCARGIILLKSGRLNQNEHPVG
jgi:hypothetical protein